MLVEADLTMFVRSSLLLLLFYFKVSNDLGILSSTDELVAFESATGLLIRFFPQNMACPSPRLFVKGSAAVYMQCSQSYYN